MIIFALVSYHRPWHGTGTEQYLLNENMLEFAGIYGSQSHVLSSREKAGTQWYEELIQ